MVIYYKDKSWPEALYKIENDIIYLIHPGTKTFRKSAYNDKGELFNINTYKYPFMELVEFLGASRLPKESIKEILLHLAEQ